MIRIQTMNIPIVVDNKAAIAAAKAFDRAKMGREAIAPYMEELCRRLRSGETDVTSLASLLTQAHDAEASALSSAYQNLAAKLSAEGLAKLTTGAVDKKKARRTDYVALAADVPEFMRDLLSRACSRYEKRAALVRGERKGPPEPPSKDSGPSIEGGQ